MQHQGARADRNFLSAGQFLPRNRSRKALPMTATAPDAPTPARQSPGLLHVVAENPGALQDGLDRAVEELLAAAPAGDRRGILITRRSQSLFTVEPSHDTPYGTVLEKDRWHRRAATRPGVAGTAR